MLNQQRVSKIGRPVTDASEFPCPSDLSVPNIQFIIFLKHSMHLASCRTCETNKVTQNENETKASKR